MEINKILSPQHGFRKNRSTINAIAYLLDKLYGNINNSIQTYLTFLDFKKAVDSVSHDTLINKLKTFGLPKICTNWFRNYLCERSQRVNLDGITSENQIVEYGVPQGSVLGPVMFSIFINDLVTCVHDDMLLYADDSNIYDTNPALLQSKLNKVVKWYMDNLLNLNTQKSKWMLVGAQKKHRNNVNITFNVSVTQLEKVIEYKYMGLWIDDKLAFQEQRTVNFDVQSKLTLFTKIRSFLTAKAAESVYKTMILPIIEYADILYDQGLSYSSNQLQLLHNRGLTITYN